MSVLGEGAKTETLLGRCSGVGVHPWIWLSVGLGAAGSAMRGDGGTVSAGRPAGSWHGLARGSD